jgi:hypothetical protein
MSRNTANFILDLVSLLNLMGRFETELLTQPQNKICLNRSVKVV